MATLVKQTEDGWTLMISDEGDREAWHPSRGVRARVADGEVKVQVNTHADVEHAVPLHVLAWLSGG